MLIAVLIDVMVNGLITPMLLMRIAPYTETKFWPVSCRYTLKPITMRLGLRLALRAVSLFLANRGGNVDASSNKPNEAG